MCRVIELRILGQLSSVKVNLTTPKYIAPAPIEDRLLTSYHIEQVCVTGADLPQPIGLLILSDAANKQNFELWFSYNMDIIWADGIVRFT